MAAIRLHGSNGRCGFNDLINSKVKSARFKDMLDVYELQRRRERG